MTSVPQATILVIDDEIQNCKLLEALLSPEGYHTVSAATGQAALALIAQKAPDLILLDVMMPDMDGYKVARIVKANPATANIPIIMVTALTDHKARLEGLDAGAEEFLTRPVVAAELWLRVRNLLRLKAYNDFLQNHAQILEEQVQARTADLQRFRTAMDATADAVVMVNRTTMRFIEVNATACTMLGYTRKELLQMSPMQLIPATLEELESTYDAIIAGLSMNEATQTQVLHKNGSPVQVELRRHAVRCGADCIIVGVLRDSTEQNAAQDKIHRLNETLEQRVAERTTQLESVNEELAAFSYSVAHDLRAPLRHIMGFVGLLQEDAGPLLSEEQLHHLTTISQSAKRMGDLIDALLAFSHLGRAELKKTVVNLDELVEEILGDFQAETKKRNSAWEIHPLPSVHADRALLRVVLVNLMSNALKFTGGCAKPQIEIGCAPDASGEIVIFVRDNGAGFDSKFAGKLFHVFQRLHTQREFEGTGIGLANVQRIIQRHGGRAWANGIVDGGATFYFSVPQEPGTLSGTATISGKNILSIQDNIPDQPSYRQEAVRQSTR